MLKAKEMETKHITVHERNSVQKKRNVREQERLLQIFYSLSFKVQDILIFREIYLTPWLKEKGMETKHITVHERKTAQKREVSENKKD